LVRRGAGIVAAVLTMAVVLALGRAGGLSGEGVSALAGLIAAGGGSFLLAAWLAGAFDVAALRQLWGAGRA
jgi:hypothetical protein